VSSLALPDRHPKGTLPRTVRALLLLTLSALAWSAGAARAQSSGPAASPSAPSGVTVAASLGAGGEMGLDQGKAGLLELELAGGWEHEPTRLRPELALALGKEPIYQILAIAARDGRGHTDGAFQKQLKTFVHQGQFNDAKSLKKGAPQLQPRLMPVYFKAAELATMYYADEREFTAFDDEFSGEEDVSVGGEKVKLKNK